MCVKQVGGVIVCEHTQTSAGKYDEIILHWRDVMHRPGTIYCILQPCVQPQLHKKPDASHRTVEVNRSFTIVIKARSSDTVSCFLNLNFSRRSGGSVGHTLSSITLGLAIWFPSLAVCIPSLTVFLPKSKTMQLGGLASLTAFSRWWTNISSPVSWDGVQPCCDLLLWVWRDLHALWLLTCEGYEAGGVIRTVTVLTAQRTRDSLSITLKFLNEMYWGCLFRGSVCWNLSTNLIVEDVSLMYVPIMHHMPIYLTL